MKLRFHRADRYLENLRQLLIWLSGEIVRRNQQAPLVRQLGDCLLQLVAQLEIAECAIGRTRLPRGAAIGVTRVEGNGMRASRVRLVADISDNPINPSRQLPLFRRG